MILSLRQCAHSPASLANTPNEFGVPREGFCFEKFFYRNISLFYFVDKFASAVKAPTPPIIFKRLYTVNRVLHI